MNTLSLPKGIRQRGKNFLVDISRLGVRRTSTCPSLEDALRRKRELEDELDGLVSDASLCADVSTGGKVSKGWTLRDGINKAQELPKPQGWLGSKGLRTTLINAEAAVEFFGPTRKLDSIDEDAVDEYVAHLIGKGNTNATVNRKLSALSKVFKVAVRKKGCLYKPEFPKRLDEGEGRIRQISRDNEEPQLLAHLHALGADLETDFVALLIDTGLRFSEAAHLDRRDVDFKSGVLLVHGREGNGTKNGGIRSVPMTKRVAALIQARLKATSEARLFDLDYFTFLRTWNRARAGMGLLDDDQFTPHVCRHTCASRLVQAGVSLKVVQEWMGHKSLQMTMRYAHLYPKDLLNAVAALEQ